VTVIRRLALPLTFARRELRSGLQGFRVFLACLALGVAAIAGVGSLSSAIQDSLSRDARRLAGGDVVVRATYREATPEQLARFRAAGRVAETLEMRAMARAGDNRGLVELKAVDDVYPLYGEVQLDPEAPLADALALQGGVWGAVVEESLLHVLDLAQGERVAVGDTEFEVRGVIRMEPDRGVGLFDFGPRLMIAREAVADTGLIQPGSLVRYLYGIATDPPADAQSLSEALAAEYPDEGWRVRPYTEAAPGLRRTVERLTLFLTLVGLTALLIGGIGVANAVRSHLGAKRGTIATLKCLGAPASTVFATYMTQIMILALLGIVLGLAFGAAVPFALADLIPRFFPVTIEPRLYPFSLLSAGLFGLLTAVTFSLWPLARTQQISAAALFRDLIAPARAWPKPGYLVATALAAAALAATAILTAEDRVFAAWFVAGAAGSLALFSGAARLIMEVTARLPHVRNPRLRLALANLGRPGSPTPSVVLSLGFGVTVLVAVALIEANLGRQIDDRIPEQAPTFFFIDIQPQQVEEFRRIVASVDGADSPEMMPHLRARIVAIDGVPVEEREIAPEAQWAVRNERGLTYAAEPPDGSRIVAGTWWQADYSGPPIISFDSGLARGFGVGVGDTLTFNVLGREIEAEIRNLREIEWGDLQMQFAVIFAPGALEGAPQTFIATTRTEPAAEAPLVRALTDRFPNVSAIRVKDALEAAKGILDQIGTAVRATGSISLVAGALVLAGAVAAGQRRRIYDSVVLKVLGAQRIDVLQAYLMEFAILGAVTAAIGAVIGGVVAFVVVTRVMELDWSFVPGPLVSTTLACVAITVVFGFVGVWRALGQKAAPLLRNP